jgi:O-acetyl-ADP-ribose deacetylase (regulator of RNase III)
MNGRFEIVQGDITRLAVDAIVNAANESLLGGGGVSGAIHRAAGPQLLAECLTLNVCPTGEACITKGYNLPARYVIHTVGPVWDYDSGAAEDEQLAHCYRSCFSLARQHGLRTLAFPAISCGIYGFPIRRAVPIALREIGQALQENPQLEKVIAVCFEQEVFDSYQTGLAESMSHATGSADSIQPPPSTRGPS